MKRRQRLILDVLEDIRDQRSKLKLSFDEGVTSIKDLSGTLLDFDASGLTVEVSSLKGASHAFDGQEVTCFFRVHDREVRAREQYLSFDTRVLSTVLRPSGLVQMGLLFPQNLRSAQLRRSVRVKVDARKVPECILWPDMEGVRDITRVAPLMGAEHMAAKLYKVDNFSANGFRLLVAPQLMRAALPEPVRGQCFAVSFRAVGEPGTPPVSFWARAALRNIFHDPQSGETALGFEFLSEGFMDEERGLVWRPLKFDEVAGLGKFVFKWNLDLYREKGMG
jgi:hypothetical protein